MGLKLETFDKLPDFGRGVTLAFFQELGIFEYFKERFKIFVNLEGDARTDSLNTLVEIKSIAEDLFVFRSFITVITSSSFMTISGIVFSHSWPSKNQSLS